MNNRAAAQIQKRSGVFWNQKEIDGFLPGKEDNLRGGQRDLYDNVNILVVVLQTRLEQQGQDKGGP
jgi:hypothetical protein